MNGIVFLLTVASLGHANGVSTYDFGGRAARFVRIEKQRLTISQNCAKKSGGELRCQAYRAFAGASLQGLTPKQSGPFEGRKAICSRSGGRIVIGQSPSQDERSFCLFKDSSMVDLGSLYQAALSRHIESSR